MHADRAVEEGSVRVLMVCMTNPSGGLKGDTKLVKKRRETLEQMNCVVDILYFEWSWYKLSVGVERSRSGVGVDIVARIGVWQMLGWLIRARKMLTTLPFQTWVSFGVASVLKKHLEYVFSSYRCIHFFHIRSAGLWGLVPRSSRVIADVIDSYTLNIGNRINTESCGWKRVLLKVEYKRIKRMETNIEGYFSNIKKTTVVAVAEADIKHIGMDSARKVVVPVGISRRLFGKSTRQQGKLRCIFFGNLDYEPNVKACHVIESTARLLRSRGLDSDVEITVAGRNIGWRLKRRLEKERIKIKSPVGDMHELVRGHDLAIMPMVSGSGMQSKVLEAIAWGVVVLTTARAAKPVGLDENRDYIRIESAEDLVERLIGILHGRYDLNKIRENASDRIRVFEWEKTCKLLLDLYEGR